MFGKNINKPPLFYGPGGGRGSINAPEPGSRDGCSCGYCGLHLVAKTKPKHALEQLAEQAESQEEETPEYSGVFFLSL